jgi:hypothetical protein
MYLPTPYAAAGRRVDVQGGGGFEQLEKVEKRARREKGWVRISNKQTHSEGYGDIRRYSNSSLRSALVANDQMIGLRRSKSYRSRPLTRVPLIHFRPLRP